MGTFLSKFTSRKFWVAVAAGLASLGSGVTGIATGNEGLAMFGLGCTVASAAIYAAAEAYVDGKSVASTTVNTTINAATSGTATKAVVDSVFDTKDVKSEADNG